LDFSQSETWITQWSSLTSGATALLLAAHRPHLLFGVAFAGDRSPGHGLLDAGEIVPGERYSGGAGVVLQVLAALGPRDGDYFVAPGQQPREDELPWGNALGVGSWPVYVNDRATDWDYETGE